MRYLDLLPEALRQVRDFSALDRALTPLCTAFYEKAEALLTEVNAATATEYGIARLERMLGLSADTLTLVEREGLTLDERRFRLQGIIAGRGVLSERRLQALLDEMFGAGRSFFTLDRESCRLTISFDGSYADRRTMIAQDIQSKIPANLTLSLAICKQMGTHLHAGAALTVSDRVHLQ